ncbi:urease accessory protein UreD [Polynucleobacter sp. JS-Safj-400b-B2]|uniref:urease accessory protein UreD n=1 Tax=Polynucleobacter sp. JS-Safj-400b-B2 TaxID=2576921 RepID=UPI001C0E31BA|nr:urease accessory protein UreD [Polynucleobacter sp. JS-Safj-400b-B2]MBU3626340.1 urease accessory protein UreD [Polynucleobacter sp. JS-Safj-400b-B2]
MLNSLKWFTHMFLAPDNAVKQLFRSLSPSWLAKLSLSYERTVIGTVLKKSLHEGPLRVQKALYPEGDDICHTVIIHPPAGIAGGDTLDIQVAVGKGSHVVLSTPSATKWYKSFKNPATQNIQFELGENAKLDWLPQENLFFKGANSNVITRMSLSSNASFIGWDALMLGRHASGEEWSSGHIHMLNEIRRDGKLIWMENGHIDAEDQYSRSLPQLGSWPVCATLWAVGPRCSANLVETFAEMMTWTDSLRAGVTLMPQGVFLVRAVSSDMEIARNFMIDVWSKLRPIVHGVPAQPLRLWAS